MKANGPFDLSKNPKKAELGMSDINCLVCGCTLFVNSSNPCTQCQYAWSDDFNCWYCPLKDKNE